MTRPARIPSDINRPDRVIGPFTARQTALLAGTAGALYLAWGALRDTVATPILVAIALPIAALAFTVIVGRRDGLALDRLLLAACRHLVEHRLRPRTDSRADRNPQPQIPTWLAATMDRDDEQALRSRPQRLPIRSIGHSQETTVGGQPVGIIDLGGDGLVAAAVVSSVGFGLRTPAEQDGLVGVFGRYLHSLTGPTQILVRALPLDLSGHLHALHSHTDELPHPALAAAARAHLTHLAQLTHRSDDTPLLYRQIVLVLREPPTPGAARHDTSTRAAQRRLLRRMHDAVSLISPLGATVTPLDGPQCRALLADTCGPDHPDPSRPAADDPPDAASPRYRPGRHNQTTNGFHRGVSSTPADTDDDDGWGPDPWEHGPPTRPMPRRRATP